MYTQNIATKLPTRMRTQDRVDPSTLCQPCRGSGLVRGATRHTATGSGALFAVRQCRHCLGHGTPLRPEDKDQLSEVPSFSY